MNTITKREILTGKQSVDNYPYGRLKCTMFFYIEFKKGKGYRAVNQSINPKTGTLNKPHYGTYNTFMYMYREAETGHIKFSGWNIYGYENIQTLITLLTENEFTFTEEQSIELWIACIGSIRSNAMYTTMKEGYTIENLLDTCKVKEMIAMYKDKKDINCIKDIKYSIEEINSMIGR